MKIQNMFWFIAISLLLAGCGVTWVNLDGSKAQAGRIEAAKTACEVNEKFEQISAERNLYEFVRDNAINQKAKETAELRFQTIRTNLRSEIKACMRKQGLTINNE